MIARKILHYKEDNSFLLLTDSIVALCDVPTVSSHVTTRSSTRLSMYLQSFKYSQMSQFLSHSRALVLGFQA